MSRRPSGIADWRERRALGRLLDAFARELDGYAQTQLIQLGAETGGIALQASRPTAAEIEAARTPAGGWTREQLAEWGVPWPPPKGWKRALIRTQQAA